MKRAKLTPKERALVIKFQRYPGFRSEVAGVLNAAKKKPETYMVAGVPMLKKLLVAGSARKGYLVVFSDGTLALNSSACCADKSAVFYNPANNQWHPEKLLGTNPTPRLQEALLAGSMPDILGTVRKVYCQAAIRLPDGFMQRFVSGAITGDLPAVLNQTVGEILNMPELRPSWHCNDAAANFCDVALRDIIGGNHEALLQGDESCLGQTLLQVLRKHLMFNKME